MEKLLPEILRKITPTEKEHKKEREIIKEISKELDKFEEVEPLLVGSLAKKTDVRHNKDVDIFIKFHKKVPREELEKKGLNIAQKVFQKLNIKYEIDYAEHPYTIGKYKGYDVEIVPCYDVEGKPQSAVDRTPFHTQYVLEKLEKNSSLRDEIRLLKKFMQGVGVYGAEAKVQGFSGYLTELLVINYGSFLKVLENTQSWRFPQILDPENLWKKYSKEDLKYFFSEDDLIVVDPVDKDRNAASAVSEQKLSEFIIAARKFLKSPQEKFFFPSQRKPLPSQKLRKRISSRETKILAILFTHSRINPNTLYSQLRKTQKSTSYFIQEKGFQILKSGEWSNEEDKSILIFEFEVWSLPKVEHWTGPPVDTPQEEQEKFLRKYKNTYVEGKRLVADRKREFQKVRPLLKKILKDRKGFGKKLRKAKAEVLSTNKIIKKLSSEKDFLVFLEDFLKPL